MFQFNQLIKGFKEYFLENPYLNLFLICVYYSYFWVVFNFKKLLDSCPEEADKWVFPLILTFLYPFAVYIFTAKNIKEFSLFPLLLFYLPSTFFAFIPYWFGSLSLIFSVAIAIGYFIIFIWFMFLGKLQYIILTISVGTFVVIGLIYNIIRVGI